MLARKSGHIVVTSSDAGRKVFPGLANYSATKFFVEAFCQGMQLENADRGLRVTTIQPGDCKTELSQLTTDEAARSEFAQQSNDREFWLDPEDVAQAVLNAVMAPNHVGINEILVVLLLMRRCGVCGVSLLFSDVESRLVYAYATYRIRVNTQ